MLPRFEIAGRQRPVTVVGAPVERFVAPYAAVAGAPGDELALTGAGGTRLALEVVRGRVELVATVGGDSTRHRSRRHGRLGSGAEQVALTLTGHQLTALALEDGQWRARARVDLRDRLDTHRPEWLDTLRATGPRAGAFGQLGLRDIRLVTQADGAPYVHDGDAETVWLTATSAGPGFFDTAHTSVWTLDRRTLDLQHRADLFFCRPDARVYGDHATHLVRDGDHWLVTTSTWADFPAEKKERREARVRVLLAESTADLTTGQHVLAGRPLELPTDGPSVGVWDPHLVRTGGDGGDGGGDWLLGYVSARRFFDFHPVLASGPSLDDLRLRGAATDRRATEGTTLVRSGGQWHVLASDGRENRRGSRRRYPVLDLDLRDTGTLEAPYPTNIPWPTLVPPPAGDPGGEWLLVTFDGTSYGGRLAGYGTHGDVVTMRSVGD